MSWRVDSEVQQMLRESAKSYLSSNSGPAHFRVARAGADGFDAAAWAQMGELGWTGMLLPEAVGGSDLGLEPALTLAEELGQAIAPEPFVASAIIAGTLLAQAEGARAAHLAQALTAGQMSITLAWQESSGQIGVPQFATRIRNGTLTGHKVHVPAWHGQTRLLVAATGPNGPTVAIVEATAPGLTVATQRMSDTTMSATLSLDGVALDQDAIILEGEAAHAALTLALARGTIAVSAQLEGLAGALWHRTTDYMKQRVQFDQPLADFQALRHRVVDLFSGIELAAASWRAAQRALDAGATDSVAIHAAKARCSDIALEMSRWAIQYHGAFGYTDEADIGLYVHAALRWSSWLGNAAAHRRHALATHRRRNDHHG